jgi:hypothetical protein
VAAAFGLAVIGLVIRAVIGVIVAGVLVLFLWKLSKLVDAYTAKLKSK